MSNVFESLEKALKNVFTPEISAEKQAEIIAASQAAVQPHFDTLDGEVKALQGEIDALKTPVEAAPVVEAPVDTTA